MDCPKCGSRMRMRSRKEIGSFPECNHCGPKFTPPYTPERMALERGSLPPTGPLPENAVASAKIQAWFDGCCEPVNPGGTASYGAVVYVDGEKTWECSEIFFPEKGKEKNTSNNVAEYCGFLAILDWLLTNGYSDCDITIHGDSNLVIKQMQRKWKLRKGHYIPIAHKAMKLMGRFKRKPKLAWVPRDQNTIADELSKARLKKAGVEFRIQREEA